METAKRVAIFFVVVGLLAVALSVATHTDYRNEAGKEVLRVGVGDDITGLLMEDVAELSGGGNIKLDYFIYSNICQDRCQQRIASKLKSSPKHIGSQIRCFHKSTSI